MISEKNTHLEKGDKDEMGEGGQAQERASGEREREKIFVLISEQKKTFAQQAEKNKGKSGNRWQHLH